MVALLHLVGAVMLCFGLKDGWQVRVVVEMHDITEMAVSHFILVLFWFWQCKITNEPSEHVFGRSWSTRTEPMCAWGEHTNSTQKDHGRTGSPTGDLLALRQ